MVAVPPDTSNRGANIRTFIKVRASLDPVDVVTNFRGPVYAFLPGVGSRHLFTVDGYSIGRAVACDGGYDLVTREVMFYRDASTNDFLTTWTNPITNEVTNVLDLYCDPVYVWCTVHNPHGPWTATPEVWGDDVHISASIFLRYPNPLPPDAWPRESSGPMYEGAELVRFIASKDALQDSTSSVPCSISSVCFGPWLPWMLMGADQPGQMIYHLGGRKLMGGYAELPVDLRAKVEAERPEFMFAPNSVSGPNETGWTLYAKERRPAHPLKLR